MSKRVEKNEKITKQIEKEEQKEVNKSKAKKIVKIVVIMIILIFTGFYYMRFIETKMIFVKEVKIESQKISEILSGLKIVHFSDLHYKMSTEEKDLKKLITKLNKLKPDIVIFTGDLLDNTIDYTEEDYQVLTENLKNISATMSKYYVKGNHDYFTYKVDTILQNADFLSLNNNSDSIYGYENDRIQIIGFGSFIQNDFDLSIASEMTPSEEVFTIAVFHEPDNILELQNLNVDLALAGHSHNSQIRIPYISDLFTVEGAKTYYKNHYQVNNTELYVNSGIGTSIYRLRLFAPPTINLYRLVSKQ